MNTIDDLRAALAADAATVAHDEHPARAAGVQGRIRTRRRRRQAGLAAAAAAVAAVVGFGVLPALDDGPAPDDELEVAGHVVPREVRILDFPYRFETSAESEPGEGHVELDLPASGAARAVTVAVDDLPPGSTAALRLDGVLLARVVGPSRLDDPFPIGDDGTLTLTVTGGSGDTRVGLATYERTADLAPGLADTSGTVVFRDRVAGKPRLGAVFARPGAAEASFTVTGRLTDIDVARHCDSNGAPGVYFVMSIDDGATESGRCRDVDDEDPAGGGYVSSGGTESGRHEVRIWTTDRLYGEEVVAFPGTVLGAAAYGSSAGTVVRGAEVPEVIERDGRLWQLEDAVGRRHRLDDLDGPRVLGMVPGPDGAWLEIREDLGPVRTSDGLAGGAGAHAITDVVWPGRSYELSLVDVDGDPAAGAILVYRPMQG